MTFCLWLYQRSKCVCGGGGVRKYLYVCMGERLRTGSCLNACVKSCACLFTSLSVRGRHRLRRANRKIKVPFSAGDVCELNVLETLQWGKEEGPMYEYGMQEVVALLTPKK